MVVTVMYVVIVYDVEQTRVAKSLSISQALASLGSKQRI
jgi:CRISPR/Cas system-associated endoribonuclease Cas2